MSSRRPTARFLHAAVGVRDKLFISAGQGGHHDVVKAATLETFNVSSMSWEQPQQLKDSLPDGLHDAAITSEGECMYSFGGGTYSGQINNVYEMNPCTLLCKELLPSSPIHIPQKQEGSRCVCFKRKLVVYGGSAYTDDLHVFDLDKRKWAVQYTTGEKPPPLAWHTFTKIDHHRAVVFGGVTKSSTNDTYILDMETWHWKKIISKVKPLARSVHAACGIAGSLTEQQHPLLMVVGGLDENYEPLSDVWLLDVDKEVWNEVALPTAITPRHCHSAVAFGSGAGFKIVVLFGGKNYECEDITETTVLLLELTEDLWHVSRVVKPDELGKCDESLREHIKKLELYPWKANDVRQSLREEQNRNEKAERQLQSPGKGLFDIQTPSTAAATLGFLEKQPTQTSEGRTRTKRSSTSDASAAITSGKHTTHTSARRADKWKRSTSDSVIALTSDIRDTIHRARVLYDFTGDRGNGELVIKEGDEVVIFNQDICDGWLEAKVVSTGETGFLPETYIEYVDDRWWEAKMVSAGENDLLQDTYIGDERKTDKENSCTADIAAAMSSDETITRKCELKMKKTSPIIDIKDIQVGHHIGQGGFGAVFEAKWRKRKVAVKVCPGNMIKNVPREIEVLTSLPPHTNVLTFFGVALVSDGISTMIITELAPNGSLHNYLHVKNEVVLPDQSLAWAQQIASGMQHLHSNNIVHRDLKSANVLLALGLLAKICDFGTARSMVKTSKTTQKGTMRWMAPEVVGGVEADINKMCDVFSYGMVLYEIFARKVPYNDIATNALAGLAVLQGKRPPVPATLPPFLRPLLEDCWKDEPTQRPKFKAIVLTIQTESYE